MPFSFLYFAQNLGMFIYIWYFPIGYFSIYIYNIAYIDHFSFFLLCPKFAYIYAYMVFPYIYRINTSFFLYFAQKCVFSLYNKTPYISFLYSRLLFSFCFPRYFPFYRLYIGYFPYISYLEDMVFLYKHPLSFSLYLAQI